MNPHRLSILGILLSFLLAEIAFAEEPKQQSLLEARRGFVTQPRKCAFEADEAVPQPPAEIYSLVRYQSPVGKLAALVSPDPGDGKKHPAVVWCHGGFGGIGPYYWQSQPAENDQTPKAFLDAGFVVMVPSWRGENDNPGRFELFLGEVDDALAAVDHVRALAYVDPDSVYMIGHSTGGTIATLCALSSNGDGRIRGVFAFGGMPCLEECVLGLADMIPFDVKQKPEIRVRSAVHFISTLKTPLWTIEGKNSSNAALANKLERAAKPSNVPLKNIIVSGADHFSVLAPSAKLLASKLAVHHGTTFDLSAEELQKAFDAATADRRVRLSKLPVVRITPSADRVLRAAIRDAGMSVDKAWITLVDQLDSNTYAAMNCEGLRIAFRKADQDELRGTVIDYDEIDKGFIVRIREE